VTSTQRDGLAAEARASVTRVMVLLERPTIEALEQCSEELSAAATRIQQINEGGDRSGASLKVTVAGLRKDLQRIALLLRHAWEFRAGTSEQAGYSGKGELKAYPAARTRWTLEG